MREILISILLPSMVLCFNLSPSPNFILHKPSILTQQPQNRSSYFGYSINLRKESIIIGAPRAQSTLESQRKIAETGSVFKCKFSDEVCAPYHFDTIGNTKVENTDLAYNSEKKDFQMLGAAMDGHETESSKFVVCAPKLKGDLEEDGHYLLHGGCYWVENTESIQPSGVRTIFPLRIPSKQITKQGDDNVYNYLYGESGFSVHVSENDEEILVGCPGIWNWKGSIIRYKAYTRPRLDGLSRRQTADDNPIRRRQTLDYRSEIPNPFYSDVSDDSYFGYAVSSASFLGNEVPKIHYVASAPQSSFKTGEVFVFDIEDYNFDQKIKVYNKFSGSQMGEYFGYTLLTEDFNNDGLPDIAVSGPFYSKTKDYENGAVYIFINKGNLAFEQQKLITSEYDFNGRFGTALGKIGDINLDGYNDLAIAAPFEGDGVVYIHLGGPDGVSLKPSQRLEAPSELPSVYEDFRTSMFGHSISRGVDMDANGYRDIAIGAPGIEGVYLYKTYPVVRIAGDISTSKSTLEMTDDFILKVCAKIESVTIINHPVDVNVTIAIDSKYHRASTSKTDNSNIFQDTIKLTSDEHCWDFQVFVKGTQNSIFQRLEIDFKYDLVQKIPQHDVKFCESCVILDPRESKSVSVRIPFNTGCGGERCISDLQVAGTLSSISQPYVLGSTRTIVITYEITNAGESAYFTQLNVSIPISLTQFSKIPSTCHQENNNPAAMICDINSGKPVKNGEKVLLDITLDATKLDGDYFEVFATVTSAGDEKKPEDNDYINKIILTEFSDVELVGTSTKSQLSIEEGLRIENIEFGYKIYNNGPSTIKELIVSIQIPTVYIPKPNYHIQLLDFNEIGIQGFYVNKVYDVTWIRDNKILVQSFESSTPAVIGDNILLGYQPSKNGMDYEFGVSNKQDFNDDFVNNHNMHRRRRSAWEQDNKFDNHVFRVFNSYTGAIDEYHASYRIDANKDDVTLKNLPKNRTILLDCHDDEMGDCVEAQFTIHNFRPGNEPISINMNFSLNLAQFVEIFTEEQNIFVFKTQTKLIRSGDEQSKTMKMSLSNPYTIVYEKLTASTPIWLYIVSILVGLLLLILITYAFYRCGFFKRESKEELQKMRQSVNFNAEELKNLNIS